MLSSADGFFLRQFKRINFLLDCNKKGVMKMVGWLAVWLVGWLFNGSVYWHLVNVNVRAKEIIIDYRNLLISYSKRT